MKFAGVPYPIRKNPKGFFFIQDGIEQIKSDMIILLLTNPGERVMLPDFGTPLRKLIFQPNDPRLITAAREMIAKSLRKWEPRVEITQIDIKNGIDENNGKEDSSESGAVLLIRILFVDRLKLDKVNELKLEVPLN